MIHVRILLHAAFALLPTLVGRWIVRWIGFTPMYFAYNCAFGGLLLFVLVVLSFFPLVAAIAARNARFPPGDLGRKLAPIHPVGWITILGSWGHIPALWAASKLSGDPFEVSFSLLGPLLIAASVALSWRYVLKKDRIQSTRPKTREVDAEGPDSQDF